MNFNNPDDQIRLIFNKLGSMNENDLSFVTNQSALNYLNKINENISGSSMNYLDQFAGLTLDWRKLLCGMLEFNPYFRLSARELIKNKLFDEYRIIENEKQSSEKIKLVVDADESFDYESCKSNIFCKEDYIKMIY